MSFEDVNDDKTTFIEASREEAKRTSVCHSSIDEDGLSQTELKRLHELLKSYLDGRFKWEEVYQTLIDVLDDASTNTEMSQIWQQLQAHEEAFPKAPVELDGYPPFEAFKRRLMNMDLDMFELTPMSFE